MKYSLPALKKAVAEAFSKSKPLTYQVANIKDGNLIAIDSSALKYAEVREAAKFLEGKFSFTDYGCASGLFGLLLKQDFEGVSGKLVNTDKRESDICRKVVSSLGVENLEVIEKDLFDCDWQSDLTLYLSVLPHVLASPRSVTDVVERVVRQTKVLAVVECLAEVTDALTGKLHKEEELKMIAFLEALRMRMKVISKTLLRYNENTTRVCYIFKK